MFDYIKMILLNFRISCCCDRRNFPSTSPSEAGDTGGVTLAPTRAPVPRRPVADMSIVPSNILTSYLPSWTPSKISSLNPTEEPCILSSRECLSSICSSVNNTNIAVFGCGHSLDVSSRGDVNGPIDMDTQTSFIRNLTRGSTYESTDADVLHWWQINLGTQVTISQVKIFACSGSLCHPEGKKLDQIQVDIFDGPTVQSTFSFFYDNAPVLDLVLPTEVKGQSIRITKMQKGKVLSLSEVQVMGR